MRILAHEIDENGFFKADVFVHYWEQDLPNVVTVHVPEGLQRPKWTGKEWVEGEQKTNTATAPVVPSLEERLKSVEDTLLSLLATSLDNLENLESE